MQKHLAASLALLALHCHGLRGPAPLTFAAAASVASQCNSSEPMCVLSTDPVGNCPTNCSVASELAASSYDLYYGGDNCQGGTYICTCYLWGSVNIETVSVSKAKEGDGWSECKDACVAEADCTHAHYSGNGGSCYLLSACNSMVSIWVGNGANQGGVTYVKGWQPSPAPTPVPTPPPPEWVNVSDNTWPFWGVWDPVVRANLSEAEWDPTPQVLEGWDW